MLVYPLTVTLSEPRLLRDRWLTKAEAAKLMRAAVLRARRFILVSLCTGCRMSAVLELT